MKNKNIPFKIGHVLIQVNHLETAIRQYSEMGFQVVPGGVPGKTHNALIYLKDGSFLELFSTNHGKVINTLLKFMVKIIGLWNPPYSSRLARYLPGQEGLRDYALDSVPGALYQENIDKLLKNGLKLSKPRPKSRTEHHGIKLKWTLCCPDSIRLPFLMSEYHPSPVIEVQDTSHANGAAAIHEIRISTSEWNKTYEEYALLLGIEPSVTLGKNGRSCLFPIQSTSIHLVENQKDGIDHIILTRNQQSENPEKSTSSTPFILFTEG
ncbi:hypothetical protein LAD12857_20500 [Lacrimispora amygdalina]|uniref:Glyoxalase-like domain-containing protein n=1 Tax=Lacrimispora amygdalina TaxID=253257 RepID=A0ABQ5M5K7_9FIRM